MKKPIYLLGTLLLTAALAACSSDYDDPPEQPNSHQNEVPVDSVDITPEEGASKDYTVISTVPVSQEVKTFFDEALPPPDVYGNILETDFYMDTEQYSDHAGWPVYHVINNMEELQQRYLGDKVIPEINFNDYTLIIGHCLSGTPPKEKDSYFGINVLCYADHNEVNIMEQNYHYYAGIHLSYFWGIFSKIQGDFKGFTWNYTKWK